jgi:hypothetical protein
MNGTSTQAPGTPVLGQRGSRVALVLGILTIVNAIVVVGVAPPPENNDELYERAGDYVRDALFLVFLIGTIAAVEVALRRRVAPRVAGRLIQVGYSLVAVGVAIGLALRDDPDWFFLLAGPGILASIVGFVWWAIVAWRGRQFPVWLAALLGVGGVTAILGADAGTTVLIGSFWIALSLRRSGDGATA